MIKLRKVFSGNSIFQADAKITLWGKCEGINEINCSVKNSGGEEKIYAGKLCDNGEFAIEIETPHASYEKYTLTVYSENESVSLSDVMFGEVWLASGQSNMELTSMRVPEAEDLYDEIKDKNIRIYYASYPALDEKKLFSLEPDHYMDGHWVGVSDPFHLSYQSAVASKFISVLYDILNRDAEIPVAFINSSWGGTSITSWFPFDEINKDSYIKERLEQLGIYPTEENFNKNPETNYQQTSVQYNCKIAQLEGLKFRGVLWYQGENETAAEFKNKVYADYLRFYHRVYSERFAVDPDNFKMISSLIFPCGYGGTGECNVGYINNAFITTAIESPDKFAAVPNGDLVQTWDAIKDFHVIHPTRNKYPLGERMARLTATVAYGKDGEQKSPAYMDSHEIVGNRVRVHFASVGAGLRMEGKNPIGLYIAGDDGIYMPAECEIISNDTLEAWCEAIDEPKNIAYSMQSVETLCNLFAGDYPVFPFFTDKENCLTIEAKPWYDTMRTSVWAYNPHGGGSDLFYHPIWQPEYGSEVCHDSAFTLEGQSIRVASESLGQFGCFVRSYRYNWLDLQNYKKMTVSLYHTKGITAILRLECKEGVIDLAFTKVGDLRGGFETWEADLTSIPPKYTINKMHFLFTQSEGNYHFVNMEKIRLWK